MKTFSKLVVTFGILGLFVLVVAFVLASMMSGLNIPSLKGGDISVIPIYGEITLGGCPGGIFVSGSCAEVDVIKSQLEEAEKNPSVKAILLDVYSGGGNVVASRELMRAVKKTSQKKPVVAWIGEVGASGAYYAASAANLTIADENSMTGSIGVIMFVQHYYGLMDKLGVNVTVVKAGDTKDLGSPYRPMSDTEKAELQRIVNKVYESFLRDVAENRKLDLKYVRNISEGRIYLGSEAKDLGLIDKVGGFDDAIDVAAKMGGITGKPGIKKPEKKVTFLDLLR